LLDYYRQNSWKVNSRTNINSENLKQIETWSKLDFKNYLSENFAELDLQNQAMKKIFLSKYKDVFSNTENIDYFPTLADWYAMKKVSFLSQNGLFTKNELVENKKIINTVYDDLILQNSGNSKLYFMHQKLIGNCSYNSCNNLLSQLQDLLKVNIDGDYKVLIAEQIINDLVSQNKQKRYRL